MQPQSINAVFTNQLKQFRFIMDSFSNKFSFDFEKMAGYLKVHYSKTITYSQKSLMQNTKLLNLSNPTYYQHKSRQ